MFYVKNLNISLKLVKLILPNKWPLDGSGKTFRGNVA